MKKFVTPPEVALPTLAIKLDERNLSNNWNSDCSAVSYMRKDKRTTRNISKRYARQKSNDLVSQKRKYIFDLLKKNLKF